MTTKKRTVTETPSIQAFLTLQRSLHKITSDIYSTLHTNNLTASQFVILEALHKHGPMFQRDLAPEKVIPKMSMPLPFCGTRRRRELTCSLAAADWRKRVSSAKPEPVSVAMRICPTVAC